MATTAATPQAHERLLASLGSADPGRRTARTSPPPAPPYDPVQAYVDQLVTNPHVLLLGEPGTGKSVAASCLLARLTRGLAQGSRQVGVVDARGEYAALAEALGLGSVRLYPGGPDRLNPLDAGPRGGLSDHEDVVERRRDLMVSLCEMALGRALSPVESWVLSTVVEELQVSPAGPQPVLADVVRLLANPTAHVIELAQGAPIYDPTGVSRIMDVVIGGTPVRHALGRLLDRELRGTFDASTTVANGGSGPGMVVDLSAFFPYQPVQRFVAVAACAWIEASAAASGAKPGDFPRRYNLVDEAHLLMRDEHASRYLASFLARSAFHGAACIVVAHRLDDLRWGDVTDPSTHCRRASAFVDPIATRVAFRQSVDQVALTTSAFGLSAQESAVVFHLNRGLALWRVGGAAGVLVQHDIGPEEWALCDHHAMVP